MECVILLFIWMLGRETKYAKILFEAKKKKKREIENGCHSSDCHCKVMCEFWSSGAATSLRTLIKASAKLSINDIFSVNHPVKEQRRDKRRNTAAGIMLQFNNNK